MSAKNGKAGVMSNILRKYRRRMLRQRGMLPPKKKGRIVPFRTWSRAISALMAKVAWQRKQKSIKEQLEEEAQEKEKADA